MNSHKYVEKGGVDPKNFITREKFQFKNREKFDPREKFWLNCAKFFYSEKNPEESLSDKRLPLSGNQYELQINVSISYMVEEVNC